MDRIGRYKVVRELGRGAMGVVYHAIDPNIGRPVAIKTIELGSVRKPEEQERLRERLFREARSAGSLSHPGIVTIYDVEQQGGLAYIAMEYVDGPTLDHLLSGPQPIAPERMFSILGQTAAALDYAHQKGIVHRDIKPANIMIAGDGTVKITDFGIAKVAASEQFTMTGSIVGTPHYMSPEQVQGQAVDGRSDQFSLAVIAFEMLTGEKPYTGEHLTTVVYKIVAEEPPAPHRLNPTIAGPIEAALRKALAKKPDARYRTCQEFAGTLEKACASTKGWKTMPRGGSLNEPTAVEAPRPGAVTLPPPRHPRRLAEANGTAEVPARKSGFFTFFLAVLVAAGLLSLIGWQALPWFTSPAPQQQAERKPVAEAAKPEPQATAPASPPVSTPAAPPSEEAKPSPMQPGTTDAATPATPSETATKTVPEHETAAPKQQAEPLKTEIPAPKQTIPKQEPPKQARTEPPLRRQPARAPEVPQEIMVMSSPGGATATLDGNTAQACTTPCTLQASPGRHMVALAMPGYGVERRDVEVTTGPIELPVVVLRTVGGSLMLTSVPAEAAILVDGQPTGQNTPAELKLKPGTYRITVEKNGRQATQVVEMGTSISYLKILLQ